MSVFDRFRLDGRVALVTGGNRGMGRVMAEAFAEAGASVAIVCRGAEEAQRAAEEVEQKTGRTCRGYSCDVAEHAKVPVVVEAVAMELGGLDVLVNNAGVTSRGKIEDIPLEEYQRLLDINVLGLLQVSRCAVPYMKAKAWGRIINIGSILSTVAVIERSPYILTKGAVLQLTRAMALEWAPHGIHVNAILPGVVLTDLSREAMQNEALYGNTVALTPLGRIAGPEEIVGAALLLASEASSFMTGSTITVDGGWTAR